MLFEIILITIAAVLGLVMIRFCRRRWQALFGLAITACSVYMIIELVKIDDYFHDRTYGSHADACEDINDWITEAPKALAQFQSVKAEILSNSTFLETMSHQGEVFVRYFDTSMYSHIPMPLLRKWFREGRGYISFREGDTSFCYQTCEKGWNTADAYIYSIPGRQRKYKAQLEIVDSLRLDEHWLAHVVKCYKCNE